MLNHRTSYIQISYKVFDIQVLHLYKNVSMNMLLFLKTITIQQTITITTNINRIHTLFLLEIKLNFIA